MHVVLKNKNLEVEIGAPMELYRGSRFDLSGNIFQVTLNNKHTFCTSEKEAHNPAYGFGLLNEFDIDKPHSYSSARKGESFHKIGVGTLVRETDDAYDFSFDYNLKPLKYLISKQGAEQIVFAAESPAIRGMKYSYVKTVSIERNTLSVEYLLENCGDTPFNTTEYCHNFLAINREPINTDYVLEIGANILPEHFTSIVNTDKLIFQGNNKLTFESQPVADFFISGLTNGSGSCNNWTLINTKHNVAIKEELGFYCNQMNLWGNGHVISPELFYSTFLEPGKISRWKRLYTFFEL